MKHRRAPRRAGGAVGALADSLEPLTELGRVQRAWPGVAGEALTPQATPTAAVAGVVTLTCASAVYAQELTLMAGELVGALNRVLGPGSVRELRCSTAPSRSWVRPG